MIKLCTTVKQQKTILSQSVYKRKQKFFSPKKDFIKQSLCLEDTCKEALKKMDEKADGTGAGARSILYKLQLKAPLSQLSCQTLSLRQSQSVLVYLHVGIYSENQMTNCLASLGKTWHKNTLFLRKSSSSCKNLYCMRVCPSLSQHIAE